LPQQLDILDGAGCGPPDKIYMFRGNLVITTVRPTSCDISMIKKIILTS